MKHLLNNISEEEKNRIREQHEGGMRLAIDNFKKLVVTKLGDAKPYLTEASQETCESCGGMMVEGECVEQCGSMKEEVSEQYSEQDIITMIEIMVMKLPIGRRKDLKSMSYFDDKQKIAFFDRMQAFLNEVMSEELDEQKDDPNSKSKEMGYKVGPIPGTAHFKGMEFDVSPSPIKNDRIKLQSELRQSESLNIIEFDYSFAPTKSRSGFVAPAEFNCNTKMLYLPYDSEGGKDAKNYAVGEKFSDMLTKFCYRTKN
mgnify:CR=1 FL=1